MTYITADTDNGTQAPGLFLPGDIRGAYSMAQSIEIPRRRPIRTEGTPGGYGMRVSLPPEVRTVLGWKIGDKLVFTLDPKGFMTMRKES